VRKGKAESKKFKEGRERLKKQMHNKYGLFDASAEAESLKKQLS